MIYVVAQQSDTGLVDRLAGDLRSAGFDVLVPVAPNPDALRASQAALVLLSPPDESEPRFVSELGVAMDVGVPLVPVLAAPCDLPDRLRGQLRADFSEGYDVALTELLVRLSARRAPAGPVFVHEAGGNAVTRPKRGSRLAAAAMFGAVGASIGAIAEILIYAGDPRLGVHGPTLLVTTILGGVVAGTLWAMAGAIAGKDRLVRGLAVVVSALAWILWIVVGGTYADVLAAAAVIGWPLGGILGATVGRLARLAARGVSVLLDALPRPGLHSDDSDEGTVFRLLEEVPA